MPSNIRADELNVKLRKRVIGCTFWVRNNRDELALTNTNLARLGRQVGFDHGAGAGRARLPWSVPGVVEGTARKLGWAARKPTVVTFGLQMWLCDTNCGNPTTKTT